MAMSLLVRLKKHPDFLMAAVTMLLVVNAIIIVLLIKSPANTSFENKYPLIEISRNFIDQEHFIVNIQPLREKINEIVQAEPEQTVSVYYEFLNTGANIQINNETSFYPASLVKVPSAMVALKKIESGSWKRSSRLVLLEEDKDAGFGDLYKVQVGTSLTIEELLEKLIIESDNTAHNIIMRNLSESDMNELKDTVGLDDLFDENSEITAKEYARLLRALYNSSFLDRSNSQYLLDILTRTRFDTFLKSGMPKDVKFAHKIGEDDVQNNFLDSGIVYAQNRPYLLTVMIKKHSKTDSIKIMEKIGRATHEFINQ